MVDPAAWAVVAVVVVFDPGAEAGVVEAVGWSGEAAAALAAPGLAVVAVVAGVPAGAGCVGAVVAGGVGVPPPTTWTTAFIQGCGSQW